MKWRFVDKFENFRHYQYWYARSKGAKIELSGSVEKGFSFSVERDVDDLTFNSLWRDHPRPIAHLIGGFLKLNSVEEAQAYVENWIKTNVPKAVKS